MQKRISFRRKQLSDLEDEGHQQSVVKVDFSTAITIFKDEYMRDDRAERSLEHHLENLSVFRKFLGSESVSEDNISIITTSVLEQFIRAMRKTGLKKNTINGRIKTLRVFFRVLNEAEYISSNPAMWLKCIKGPAPNIIPFSDEQVSRLLRQPIQSKFVGMRDHLIMQLLLDTGIRLDELVSIRATDIDIKNRSVFIRKGKGNKSRTVFFGLDTRKELLTYLKFTKCEGEDHLILNQDGFPLRPRSIQDNISRYARSAKITGVRSSPHTFRHTFAKMYLMNGGDPYTLRDLLGHSSMATVMLYVKLFKSDLQKKYKSPVDKISRARNLRNFQPG
jgi:integrase/recombinase XerD